MNTMNRLPIFITLAALALQACGAKSTQPAAESASITAAVSAAPATADPCAQENLPAQVTRVNELMREFDDYSKLASNVPQAQLLQVIPSLQDVRRRAESQSVPACLRDLKSLQLTHMNMVIEILIAFMGGAENEAVNAGVAQARQAHNLYDLEIARLLGIPVVTTTPAPADQPAPAETQPSAAGLFVTNLGANPLNLRTAPDINAETVGILDPNLSAMAVAQSGDKLWIQVELPGQPGQYAWVFASNVTPSGDVSILPVATP